MSLTGRQRRALEHQGSLCITAGAGTGKTFLLVEKYCDLIATRGLRPREILAVTFTELAAAEMRTRCATALSTREGAAFARARTDLGAARISTIHAFARQVCEEFPCEAGVAPNVAVLDEPQRTRLVREAIDGLLLSPPAGVRAPLVRLIALYGARDLAAILRTLLDERAAAREILLECVRDPEAAGARWRRTVRAVRGEVAEHLLNGIAGEIEILVSCADRYAGPADSGSQYLAAAAPHLRALRAGGDPAAHLGALLAVKGRRGLGSRGVFGDDLDPFRRAYDRVKTELEGAGAVLLLPEVEGAMGATLAVLADLGPVFLALDDTCEAEKARRNALSFDDLLVRALRVLTREPRVRRELGSRYRYLLIDEFQDTDPRQFALFWQLAGELAGTGVEVAVVGDPKQSIYGFRGADVTGFSRAAALIRSRAGGAAVALNVNFRSTPAVLAFVNHLFDRVMAPGDRLGMPAYEPIEPSPGRAQDSGLVELLLAPDPDRDLEAVARRCREIVDEGLQVYRDGAGAYARTPRPAHYGDIAILLRRRTRLEQLEQALRGQHVPYHVRDGSGLFGRQEVFDLCNLLAALVSTQDDVALYGALQSPFLGHAPAALARAAGRSGCSLWEWLCDDDEFEVTVRRLEAWRQRSLRVSPAVLIDELLLDAQTLGRYAALPEGDRCIANLGRVRERAQDPAFAGPLSLPKFVEDLRRAIAEKEREPEAEPDSEGGEAVRIMTIHKAKGLEFPIVLLPDLLFGEPGERSPVLVDGEAGIGLAVPDPANGFSRQPDPVLVCLRHRRAAQDRAERRRLLYVATTRAADHLILCGVYPVPATRASTWMGWLSDALGLDDAAVAAGRMEIPDGRGARCEVVIRHGAGRLHRAAPAAETGDPPPARFAPPVPAAGRCPAPIPVSALVRAEGEPGGTPGRGPGTAPPGLSATRWGTLLHEVCMGRDPVAALAEAGCSDRAAVARCLAYRDRFLASAPVAAAAGIHFELPFTLPIGGLVVSGAIDCLVRGPEGRWAVLDLKSGRNRDPGSLVERYGIQVNVYRRAVEALFGADAADAYLYAVESGELLPVPVDPDLEARVVRRAARLR